MLAAFKLVIAVVIVLDSVLLSFLFFFFLKKMFQELRLTLIHQLESVSESGMIKRT